MKYQRLFALLICIMLIFTSCSGDVLDPIVTDPGAEYPTDEPVSISLAGYKVVRPAKASNAVIQAAVEVRKALSAQTENITIGDDWLKAGEEMPDQALEILVGETNRPESVEVCRDLLADDFAIRYFPESGRIAICGGSDEATSKAVEHFLEFCIKDGYVESSLSFFSDAQYAVIECVLNGSPIEEYSLVIPANADADERYAAEMIKNEVLEKTGITLTVAAESADAKGQGIIIKKSQNENTTAPSYGYGESGGVITVSGDGGLVVRAARRFLDELFPKGEEKVSLTLGEAKMEVYESASYPALDDFGEKPIALADQKNASIAVYDLSSGESVLKYEFKPKSSNGFSLNGYGNRVDEARLRYSEKWGTYIIMFTSSSGYVGVASYPEEKCLWEVELKGTSPHSIEYLPNGTVAVASSGGSDTSKGFVRLYSTENKTNNRYASAKLTSAHALLWDDTREVLWALGSSDIVAYEVGDDPANPTLTKIASYGCSDMKGGHDLSAIPGNDDQVWVGGSFVRIFDKTTGKLIDNYAGVSQINSGNVKCICSFPDGDAALTVATGVYADHDTDYFKLFKIGLSVAVPKEYVFDGRAFYKARAFLAEYN